MRNDQEISQIFEGFSNWTMPWVYLQEILEAEGLTKEERTLIDKIWQEANSSAYWMTSSMQSNITEATAALKISFPWLSARAVDNVIRAASYQWR